VENSVERIIIPTVEEIAKVNQSLIDETGGAFYLQYNLRNSAGLEWALGTIQCPILYGVNTCPKFSDKTALVAWTIINDHVFYDGNKRTGMAVIRIMHLDNNIQFYATDNEFIETARKVMDYRESGFTKDVLSKWIEERTK
jgi:death-on-curing protein